MLRGDSVRTTFRKVSDIAWGRVLGLLLRFSGGDVQVAVDGNFNHRHLKSAGDCPEFYTPQYVLSKEQIDEVGKRIEKLRKTPAKVRRPVVPDEAVNERESSHTAGSGSNSKTNMEKFDDGGQMALVCRHDIPLFLANIDTPGEQQKYAVALIEHLYFLLPPDSTAVVLYDVGCVLDRSLQMVSIHVYFPATPIFTGTACSMISCQLPLWTDSSSLPVPCMLMPTSGPASSFTIPDYVSGLVLPMEKELSVCGRDYGS